MSSAKTLYQKLWDAHVVVPETDAAPAVLFIDLHLIHEVTSPQAFSELKQRGLSPRCPERTKATMDHSTPTLPRNADGGWTYASDASAFQVQTLTNNCQQFGIELFDLDSHQRGIVHVIAPEMGFTQPGMTIVCGDSHTSTHGAFGALAFGIGSSEVGHVLATQCMLQRQSPTMAIRVEGELPPYVGAKDLILHIIGKIGVNGGTGHVIEYQGSTIRSLDMEQRMTLCNMSIEAGARAGMVAPDATTFAWLEKAPRAPKGDAWENAIAYWKTLYSDANAVFDQVIEINAADIQPTLTWGTHPGTAIAVNHPIPSASNAADQHGLDYMQFSAGQTLSGTPVDVVFVGSCTNGRLSDIRQVAEILKDKKIASHVRMLVVPGSAQVKRDAEAEGLNTVIQQAGAEWREAGCSMCIAMNGDLVAPGQLAVSTSNRNFEGRQGKGSRTLLASPLMAAWAAIHGVVTDPRHVQENV